MPVVDAKTETRGLLGLGRRSHFTECHFLVGFFG